MSTLKKKLIKSHTLNGLIIWDVASTPQNCFKKGSGRIVRVARCWKYFDDRALKVCQLSGGGGERERTGVKGEFLRLNEKMKLKKVCGSSWFWRMV